MTGEMFNTRDLPTLRKLVKLYRLWQIDTPPAEAKTPAEVAQWRTLAMINTETLGIIIREIEAGQ